MSGVAALVAVLLLLAACGNPLPVAPAAPPRSLRAQPPLTASGTVTWQPQGSGPALTWTTTYYRDSRGRTRIETIVPGTATSNGGGEPVVLIADPVAGKHWRVYPSSGEVFDRGPEVDLLQQVSGWFGEPPWALPAARRAQADSGPCAMLGQSGMSYNVVRETADGAPVGSAQRCVSARLAIPLQTRQMMPDGALHYDFTLTSLQLGEPSAALFAPPASAKLPDASHNLELAAALFKQARAGVSSLPPETEAAALQFIATEETQALRTDDAWQKQAHADAVAIFRQVVGITFPEPDPPPNAAPGWTPPNFKENIESNLLRSLTIIRGRASADARQSQLQSVLALIQEADVRKAPLYDALLSSALVLPASPSGFQPDPAALAAQCQQSDGSFPYSGTLIAAMRQGQSGDTAGAATLLRMADAAAEADEDPAGRNAAATFLEQTAPDVGPRRYGLDLSALRADWLAATEALLRDDPPTGARYTATRRLLARLHAVDPDAAAQYPVPAAPITTGGPTAAISRLHTGPPIANPFNPASIQSDPAAALAAAQALTGPQQLQRLTLVAEMTAFNDPVIAAQADAAAIAALEASDPAAPGDNGNIMALLSTLDRVGMTDRAQALLPLFLQRAAQDARSEEAQFDQLPPDQLNRPVIYGMQAANEYRAIAQIDLAAAAAAAQQLDVPAVQPLILAAIASQLH